MSTVDLAFDCRTVRFVAVKTLLSDLLSDDKCRARMIREADIYRRLRHRTIVGFVESGDTRQHCYIIQEHLRGTSLRDLMESFPMGLPFQVALQIFEDLSEAVHAAHEASVIHRDIQPDNIMIDHEGQTRLFDFGIAYADDCLVNTDAGTIMGTVFYSSPEQNNGDEVDERADLYSLGAVLFEMLTGRRLIVASTLEEALAIQKAPVPGMREMNRDIPRSLESITQRLLAYSPGDRYCSTEELFRDLQAFHDEVSAENIDKFYGHPFLRRLRLARKAFFEGLFEEAVSIGRDIEDRKDVYLIDDLSKLHYLLGRAYTALGDYDKADRYFGQAREACPDDPDFALDHAVELIKMKRISRAFRILEEIVAVDRENIAARGLISLLSKEKLPNFGPNNGKMTIWDGFKKIIRKIFR